MVIAGNHIYRLNSLSLKHNYWHYFNANTLFYRLFLTLSLNLVPL